MATYSNGTFHKDSDVKETPSYLHQKVAVEKPGSGTVVETYPHSKLAQLLDSELAHKVLKYGIEAASFGVINLFFPKRTSWVARVALPLAVNYLLGKWIEENYNEWVATLAQRDASKEYTQDAIGATSPATT